MIDKDTELQWIALTAIDKAYENQIEEDSKAIADAKSIVDEYLSRQGLESNIEVILREICESQVKANYFFDQSKTDEAIKRGIKRCI